MIFNRLLVNEFASSAGGVFTVLFSVVVTIGLVTILGEAAGGKIDSRSVFERDIYENTTELIFLPFFYFPFPIQVLLQFVLFHRHAVCPL